MKFREAQAVAAAISQWGDGQEALTMDAARVMNQANLGWVFLVEYRDGAPLVEGGWIKISVRATNG